MNIAQSFGRMMMIFGVILIIIGGAVHFGSRFGIGRLPGDIVYRRGNFTFYFPLVSGIVLSLILTLLFNLFRLRR